MLLVAGAFSGCVYEDAPTAPSSTAAAATKDVGGEDASADAGSIEGVVVDDEQSPIPNVQVVLLRVNAEAMTGADGSFAFTNVPAGTHELVAQRLGFETKAQRVTVVAGESTTVRLILVPIAVAETYLRVYPHTALHHVGGFTYLSWAVNLTNQPIACSGCVWVAGGGERPSYYLLELSGQHTVTNPAKPAGEHYWIFRESQSGGKIDECALAGNYLNDGASRCFLPIRLPFNDTVIDKTKRFWHQIMCDLHWFCFEERREIYVSLFYNYAEAEIPKDYSARPK